MPETPLTSYCNHMYDLVQRVRHFVEEAVVPAIESNAGNSPLSARRRNNAIQITFLRIIKWLKTFEKLNQTHDVQAVGAGARGVFELYLDLKWFELKPDVRYLDRFCAFPDVDRYMAAKKVVEFKASNPVASVDIAPHVGFMRRMDADAKGLLKDRVAALWGTNAKGEPRWPRTHWSGEGDLRSRANQLGVECEDAYVQLYPILSALVHPGPSPEVWASMSDFGWLEKQIAYGYFQTFRNARAATFLVCDLLKVRDRVDGFDKATRMLRQWEDDALQELSGT